MRPSLRSGLFAGVCLAGLSFGQGDPAYDHNAALVPTITAYALTEAQEAAFSVTDHAPTPFWQVWDTDVGTSLDKIVLNSTDNFMDGEAASGADEGKIGLRIAYGAAGIYLLYTATDDAWSGYTHWLDYANDACELFGCQVSALEMYNNPSTYLPCNNTPPYHQMNGVYFQIQVRFGLEGLEPVEAFSLNKWNPMLTDFATFGCPPTSNVSYDRDVTFDEAAAMGILVDIITQTDNTVRSQEWLIPWTQWGSTNPPGVSQRSKGDRLGVCFGYNDLDPAVQSDHTAIRWRKCDPYSNTDWNAPASFTGTPPATPTAMDAWGDIVFGDPLPVSSVRQSALPRRGGVECAAREYFSVDGRRLTAADTRSGLVLGTAADRQNLSRRVMTRIVR